MNGRPLGIAREVTVSLARGRVHYAWIVFGVTFFTRLPASAPLRVC